MYLSTTAVYTGKFSLNADDISNHFTIKNVSALDAKGETFGVSTSSSAESPLWWNLTPLAIMVVVVGLITLCAVLSAYMNYVDSGRHACCKGTRRRQHSSRASDEDPFITT